jgi:RNA polymerase sigma-70 factor (ECF subfamily)
VQTDAELVKAVLNGEPNMYEALVKRYERPVRAVALEVLSDHHLASDASQDAIIKAFENLSSLRRPDAWRT